MASVAAVVVTFNRLEKLKTVIGSLEAQTLKPEFLVIINNASTDGTAAYLDSLETPLNLQVVHSAENLGGAGGFSNGMRKGYELGADFVWVMDDDGYPQPDALEKLVSGLTSASDAMGQAVPFACSLVKFIDGEICEMNNPVPTWDWARLISKGQDSVLVNQCSFVSVLIPRWVIKQHGLPFKEYFIWFDDAEYTLRISKETPGIQVLSSVTVHDMGENKGVNFGTIDDSNAWKFEYGIRNEASFRLHHGSFARYMLFCAQVIVGMRRGHVKSIHKRKMRKKLFEGIRFNPSVDRV